MTTSVILVEAINGLCSPASFKELYSSSGQGDLLYLIWHIQSNRYLSGLVKISSILQPLHISSFSSAVAKALVLFLHLLMLFYQKHTTPEQAHSNFRKFSLEDYFSSQKYYVQMPNQKLQMSHRLTRLLKNSCAKTSGQEEFIQQHFLCSGQQ